MRRREFIKVIAGSAATWPVVVRAQLPDRLRRIGVLMSVEDDAEDRPVSQLSGKGCTIWVGAEGATCRWMSALPLATPIGRGPMAQN